MNYFLGNGYTAEVYELPIAPHLCVKYIHDQQAYNENNHMRVEYDFLCRLYDLSEKNIRTPIPAFLRIHPSKGHAYGMEKVNGKSLSQILEKPDENEGLINIVHEMDKNEVLTAMKAYIEKMHDMKITHNDLFMRNIMLDRDGNFFVIDFGKAKHEDLGEDREEERKRDLFLANNEISLFFNKIDKLEIK
jgi:tRNA A-37 threonylcarbamoyl transferase component Bud32